jgi:SAC3 family protein LENG8/THP3
MKLPITFISNELAFEGLVEGEGVMDSTMQGATDTVDFLSRHKVVTFTNPNAPDSEKVLDCKGCQDIFPKIFEEQYRKVTLKGRI